MAFFDLSRDQLVSYRPERTEPKDFDAFWAETLGATRSHPLDARFEPVDAGLTLIDTYDVTFNGYGGQPIKAWFLKPRGAAGPLPCVVEYNGYGGGRGFAFERMLYAAAGYAYLFMDTRGQGSAWGSGGHTPDLSPDGDSPQHPGFMTRGVLDPHTYYYRRLFTDAVRAVDAVRSRSDVDAARVAVTGGSQGGGITLAVAGLVPDLAGCLPDVPFLCGYRRATEITDKYPYFEVSLFCRIHRNQVNTVFNTLSYFDGWNFAARATAPALFSVGLMDDICPPSTVYGAFNHYAQSRKEIRVYEYNNHEGGQGFHDSEKLAFLKQVMG